MKTSGISHFTKLIYSKQNIVLIFAFLGAIFFYFIENFELQFFCFFLCISIVIMMLAIKVKNNFIQYICIFCFSITFFISAFEIYIYFPKPVAEKDKEWVSGTPTKEIFIPNENLGYKFIANKVHSHKKVKQFIGKSDKVTIYDVTYTINASARRATPVNENATIAILLLGCSFTFGDGLNDKETFGYKIAETLGQNYQVFNCGVGGYGAHQALAILEGDLSYLKKFKHIYVFYTAIEDHVMRNAGISSWDKRGPRYLFENGQLVRKGSFTENFPNNIFFSERAVHKFLQKSIAFNYYFSRLQESFNPFNSKEKRNKLFGAIVDKSVQVMKNKYPNSDFTVLLWDDKAEKALIDLPQSVHRIKVSDWLPKQNTTDETYIIIGDGHPNDLATTLMAKEIVNLIHSGSKNDITQ